MNRIITGWLLVSLLSGGPFLRAQDVASTVKALPASRLTDNAYVTLSAEGRSLDSILRDIEQQTAHTFVYSNDQFRQVRPSAQFVHQPLTQVLTELLTPLRVTYRIVGKQIILSFANQERTVSGQVVDSESGELLPGVNIAIKGTNRGVATDAKGNYRISLPNSSATLVFSYVGYTPQEIAVSNETTIDVKLVADVRGLDEVQIVAFGEQRKRDLTGSIASIKSDVIRTNTAASPDVALQGRAAGVQITQAGGTPGGAVRINVRGIASINSNSQPLIVIDGVPVLNSAFGSGGIAMNPLAEINPNDIESLEVLKDASASVLYGSRAANGVILITTKKGKSGKPAFDVSYEEGVTSATNRVKLLDNPADYFAVLKRAAAQNRLSGITLPASANLSTLLPVGILKGSDANINDRFLADSATLYNTSTDWLSETLRQGSYRTANLGVSAGTKKLSVYVSGSYRRDNGIVIGQSLERLSGRVNLTYKPIRQVQIGVNASINGLETESIPLGNSFRYALTTALPVYPVQLADGTYFNGINYGGNQINIGSNPVFYRNNHSDVTNTTRSINTAFLQVEPLAGLFLRTEWGYDYQKSKNDVLLTPTLFPAGVNGQELNGNGKADNRDVTNNTWNTNNTLTYGRKLFGNHSLKILLGNSVQSQTGKSNTFITENVPEGARGGSDTTRAVRTDDSPAFRFVSFFGRLNYAINDRYLFEASFRTDGSSRFGPGRRFASFPGVSVGWVLSDEPFLRDRLKAVSLLKLRASYGSTGNAEIGNFSWQKTFTYVGYNAAIYGGIQGGQFTNPGNQDLSWESTRQFNAGLDFGLLNNRIQGTFDFYNKISDGLLLEYSLGPLYGTIGNTMTLNLGSVRNRGLEFSISSQNIVRPRFRWTTDFNIAHNKNEVLSTYTASFLNYPYQFISGPSIAAEGYPLGTYYMPVFAGFDPVTGNELFYERDRTAFSITGQTVQTGNLWDGTVNNQSANNQFIQTGKTPYPTVFGGLTNTFMFGPLDLSFLLYYQYGNWIYDQGERSQSYPTLNQPNNNITVGQVLRAEVAGIGDLRDELRRAEAGGVYRLQWQSNARGFESTRFLHDGSFVRLKNLQIGYSLSRETARRFRLRTARIYVTGQNLLTFTKFKGWDPEIFRNGGDSNQGTANLQPGVTNNDLPQVRTVSIGLNVGF